MAAIKVLVVEDERMTARQLTADLEDAGFSVYSNVPTGEEALQVLAQEPIDFVIMDIHLKGKLNGVETVQSIQTTHGDRFPILFLSSEKDPAIYSAALTTHPVGYISKPFEFFDVRAAMETAISNLAITPVEEGESLSVSPDKDKVYVLDSVENRYRGIAVKDICWFKSDGPGPYSVLHLVDKTTVRLTITLKQLLICMQETALVEKVVRVHRSFAINLAHTDSLSHDFKNIYMSDGEIIEVSDSYKDDVKRMFIILKKRQ